jgi:hypothetical protein
MNKLLKKISIIASLFAFLFTAACSDDIDPLVTSLETSRLFSPMNFSARVINQTQIRLTWNAVNNATGYTLEFYKMVSENDSILERKIENIDSNEVPYVATGFESETSYAIYLYATGKDIVASKTVRVVATTPAEQLFSPVDPNEITATSVVLHWTAGEEVDKIVLTPGDITHSVTSDEVAAGTATITDLTPETVYEARLTKAGKTRGTITFETLMDLGGAQPIYSGDDIKAILDAATDGAAFVIFPGTYELGDYVISKSLKLSGFRPNDKPVITVRFTCESTVSSLELKNLILVGGESSAGGLDNVFEAKANCDLTALTITDCEIAYYKKHLFYNNNSGVLGTVTLSGCYVHDVNYVPNGDSFTDGGGDFIDIRSGSLTSLSIQNTTFAKSAVRTFFRLTLSNPVNVSMTNCTIYKVCNLDGTTNNVGLFNIRGTGSTLEVRNCLLVGIGKEGATTTGMGAWCKQASNMVVSAPVYSKNYYYNCPNLWTGVYTNPASCDATEADPQFTDAENGNFHVENLDVNGIAGDPRWW